MTKRRLDQLWILVLPAFSVGGCSSWPTSASAARNDPAAVVNEVADQYYDFTLRRHPEIAYYSGINLARHDGLTDNSPQARRADEAVIDELLRRIEAVDVDALVGKAEWITAAYLLQALSDSVSQRVCRSDLWDVNQMSGWHLGATQIAELQPVGSPEFREQSLTRWSAFVSYIDQEIDNLERGLDAGYSAPKSVARRVVEQLDGLLALDIEQSPFYSPALRDGDADFTRATRELIAGKIHPALQRYRDFLAGPYVQRARAELSITANPDGLACYEASLRAYTTLDRTGKDVYTLGQQTVSANKARVIELGAAAYGLDQFTEILDRVKSDPGDRFRDKAELLAFSRNAVRRAEAAMPKWIGNVPLTPVAVVPFAEHEEGTGRSAHYNPGNDERPAEYRIPLLEPEEQSRGNAEATAFHETWPGHHLQVAVAQGIAGLHPITRILWFSGPGEGWARYAEALAEEMGLYESSSGPILRRAWPARGMVVDPGIHLFGWSREEAIEFMNESGRFPAARSDEMVDRIAILPGQLTAYDSGGLEILALRNQAEQALGDDFDIREFHDRVLENGTIPLTQLRTHIEAWIEGKTGR